MLAPDQIAAVLFAQRLPLTAFVAAITRDFHLAEDIFQEVCVKAVSRDGEFDSPEHVVNWARVAGRNRAIDIVRARDGRYTGLTVELLDTLAMEWPRPSALERLQHALDDCLERLTANNRELLRLRYFERRSCADVAALMQRKVESVYQALSRVHKALGDCMRARVREGM